MFTGIVSHTGQLRKARRGNGVLEVVIDGRAIGRRLRRGDSVAVNGVCLTAIEVGRRRFSAQVMGETLARTTLVALAPKEEVNLELPVRPTDRLGGHIVQGHVDGVAEAVRVEQDGDARRLWLSAEHAILRYLVPKGSVALDGVSLTVVDVDKESFEVALIPHTLANTTLGRVRVGSRVNVEVDLVAKYVRRLAGAWEPPA